MLPVQHFDDLMYALPDSLFLISVDGTVISANPAAEEMLGLKKKAFCNKPLVELVNCEKDKVSRYLKRCLQSKDPVLGSLQWQSKNDAELDCSSHGSVLFSSFDNTPSGVLLRCVPKANAANKFSMLNVELESLRKKHHRLEEQKDRLEEHIEERTAELRAQSQALAESNAHTSAILESAADAIITFDEQGIVERINSAGERIFGYTSGELVGKNINLIINNCGADNLSATQADDSSREATGQRKDGTLFPMELSTSQVQLSQRHLFIGIMRDITQRKKAQQALKDTADQLAAQTVELEKSNQELDQFAYIASHDLKAPLRAIANLSQWIEDDLDEAMTDDTRNQMSLLRGRVQRMENLINAILQYSRVGRVEIEHDTVNVSHLLDETIDSLSPPDAFTVRYEQNMPVICTPVVLLVQVFSNLISNAIKYHDKAEGQINICVSDKGENYQFCVSDDGPGIAPEYHEKVFKIFQTLQARDKVESTGVGLTVVNKIIEGQGGKIWIESEVGQGTTFCFTWPKQARKNN